MDCKRRKPWHLPYYRAHKDFHIIYDYGAVDGKQGDFLVFTEGGVLISYTPEEFDNEFINATSTTNIQKDRISLKDIIDRGHY